MDKPKQRYWSRNLDIDTKVERQLTNLQVLMDWGFSESEIDKILGNYRSPFTLGGHGGVICSRLMNLERRLKRYGIGHDGVREIINKRPQLLSTEARTVREALRNLTRYHELRRNPEKVGRIILGDPNVLTYQPEWTNRFFSAFLDYGFTEEQVADKILLADPNRLRNSGHSIQERLANLEDLGFDKEEVIAITCRFPQIIGYSKERTNNAFRSLLRERSALGGKVSIEINEERGRGLVKSMPQLLGLDTGTVDGKLRLRMIIWHACKRTKPELTGDALSDHRVLIQGRRTILKRVAYARKNGIDWRDEKYLYQKRSQFEKKHRVNL